MTEPLRVRLDLAYRGTPFHGFAEQPGGLRTVGGELRGALERVLRSSLTLTCAGRTDAGVHARGQVVTFDAGIDVRRAESLARTLTKLLAPDIVVTKSCIVTPDFDARFSAVARSYSYTVLNASCIDPLRADVTWWIPSDLDVEAMNQGARALLGEHDFGAFCKRPDDEVSLVRHVTAALWSRDADEVRFDIEGNAFCHHMVRSIVGHLVEVGRGRRSSDEVADVLRAKDRSRAGTMAPPNGLVLEHVAY